MNQRLVLTRRREEVYGNWSGQFVVAGQRVIITTHYMDEAEYLCDRVAVLIQAGSLL